MRQWLPRRGLSDVGVFWWYNLIHRKDPFFILYRIHTVSHVMCAILPIHTPRPSSASSLICSCYILLIFNINKTNNHDAIIFWNICSFISPRVTESCSFPINLAYCSSRPWLFSIVYMYGFVRGVFLVIWGWIWSRLDSLLFISTGRPALIVYYPETKREAVSSGGEGLMM